MQAGQREWQNLVEAVLSEREGAERYRLRQRALRRGGDTTAGRRGPTQFDESGFPISQPTPGFVQRVSRLLKDT